MVKTVLVAGKNGQVASAFAEVADTNEINFVTLGRPFLDIRSDESIEKTFDSLKPDLVINAAAYTAVDDAENRQEEAFVLNALAPQLLATICARHSCPIIHLSTDYVFNGSKILPYLESDEVAPLGFYGTSKLAGERFVSAANPDAIILRTAWVYSPFRKNFVKTMLNLAAEKSELNIVCDQFGNPTSALDLARTIAELVFGIMTQNRTFEPGIFHLAGSGVTSWAGFAEEIFRQSTVLGGPSALVNSIPSSAYVTPAKRPLNSTLDCAKINATYGIEMPPWQESLHRCLQRILDTRTGQQ